MPPDPVMLDIQRTVHALLRRQDSAMATLRELRDAVVALTLAVEGLTVLATTSTTSETTIIDGQTDSNNMLALIAEDLAMIRLKIESID